jgi:hypothetical protein
MQCYSLPPKGPTTGEPLRLDVTSYGALHSVAVSSLTATLCRRTRVRAQRNSGGLLVQCVSLPELESSRGHSWRSPAPAARRCKADIPPRAFGAACC